MSTYVSGNLIYNSKKDIIKKIIIFLCLLLNVSILLVFKYGDFFLDLFNTGKSLNLLLPAGISFYTFQSLTYIMDCYRGDVKPEKNILKYALFVSFFPLIVSGPIERSKRFLPQIDKEKKLTDVIFKESLQYMLYGFFLKMAVVSRLDILTNYIFSDYLNKDGFSILCAVIGYTLKIYTDFNSYSLIACGIARLFGFNVVRNFSQPYFAVSVADFFRRWHISLSSWFRDYLYIPLGGNRKGVIRKYINVLIVFTVSGLWHGANLTFVFWGFLCGIFQVIEALCKPIKNWIQCKTKINNNTHPKLCRVMSSIITFVLISFTWIFFSANSISHGFDIFFKMISRFSYVNLINGTVFELGLGVYNLLFVCVSLFIMIIISFLCEKNDTDLCGVLKITKTPLRWGFYYILILLTLLSCNLSTAEFIYSKF